MQYKIERYCLGTCYRFSDIFMFTYNIHNKFLNFNSLPLLYNANNIIIIPGKNHYFFNIIKN
jgi:hypothetical protein